MAESETCPVDVWTPGWFQAHRCGRPIKRRGMCGVHAGAEERAEAKAAALAERKSEGQVIVDRLTGHGVSAYVDFRGAPRLGISPLGLADLLDALAAPRPVHPTEGES